MADQENRVVNFGRQSEESLYNIEIANLIEICDDGVRQVTACGSAHNRDWNEKDLLISERVHERLSEEISEYESDPQQFVPNADKTAIDIPEPPLCVLPENFGAQRMARQLALLRTQLRNGDSGENKSGFHPKELEWSIKPAVAKFKMYVDSEKQRTTDGRSDYFPDVRDQEANETTPGHPDNQY